ncbi:hypothetical protein MWN34_07755 [Ancylobacter sp. 6x-1]|uniref:Uncharacterized protein n=1 Tax=Ancylobacter crimeensis TaxID=2579147 RepID=A0ABT0DA29_9HYPH|nr:hypothetical protein [Ancylobacter crimeensis]MCK0196807.1 hypothetical protein [Ancylobacter crimeensis]
MGALIGLTVHLTGLDSGLIGQVKIEVQPSAAKAARRVQPRSCGLTVEGSRTGRGGRGATSFRAALLDGRTAIPEAKNSAAADTVVLPFDAGCTIEAVYLNQCAIRINPRPAHPPALQQL